MTDLFTIKCIRALKIFSKLQSGLRKNVNTHHSLIIMKEKRMSVNGGGQTVAVLTDLSKTSFTILVSISYISFICICTNKNKNSTKNKVSFRCTSGLLGRMLFNIYIFDYFLLRIRTYIRILLIALMSL